MPQNNEPKKNLDINVKMSPTDKSMLKQLSDDSGMGMSQIVREMISARYRMRFANEPTCVNCARCLCANMHRLQEENRLTDEELVNQQGENHGTTEE